MLARSDTTQLRFLPEIWDPTSPWWTLFYTCTIFQGSCSIVTVLERALLRKQNTRQDDEEENLGSGKSNRIEDFGIYE